MFSIFVALLFTITIYSNSVHCLPMRQGSFSICNGNFSKRMEILLSSTNGTWKYQISKIYQI